MRQRGRQQISLRNLSSPSVDVSGARIAAYGGSILRDGNKFFWYGEYKVGETRSEGLCGARVDFEGISCYSSSDLQSWKFEGVVLLPDENQRELSRRAVVERPKVVPTGTGFAMWLHIDDMNYASARVGVATSSSPVGPFDYQGSFLPSDSDSRDLTVFCDGTAAFLIFSSDWNRTLRIAELDDARTGLTGAVVSVLIDQCREAPAMWRYGDRVFMLTSGLTGWEANPPLLAQSDAVLGRWRIVDNPFSGQDSRTAWGTQPTFVFAHPDSRDHFIYMADRWNPSDLASSQHVWFVIDMTDGEPRFSQPLPTAR